MVVTCDILIGTLQVSFTYLTNTVFPFVMLLLRWSRQYTSPHTHYSSTWRNTLFWRKTDFRFMFHRYGKIIYIWHSSKLNLFYTKVTFLHYVNGHTYFHRMHDDSNDIIYQLDKAPPPTSSTTTPMHGWQVLPIPSPDAIQFFLWGMLRTVFARHIQQNLSELGKQIIAVISNIHEML